jgi:hypothetical protein
MIRPKPTHVHSDSAQRLPRVPRRSEPKFQLAPAQVSEGARPAQEAPQLPPLPRVLQSLETRRKEIDAMIDRSLQGQPLSAQDLLRWQARIYDFSQRMELFSRVVDRTVAAVKTTLNTQT